MAVYRFLNKNNLVDIIMKGSGTKIFFIVFFLALTGYYLSFTARHWLEERHMEGLSEDERSTYMEENR